MNLSWQTVVALAIVGITLAIFIARIVRPAKKRSCGHDCGCGKKPG